MYEQYVHTARTPPGVVSANAREIGAVAQRKKDNVRAAVGETKDRLTFVYSGRGSHTYVCTPSAYMPIALFAV